MAEPSSGKRGDGAEPLSERGKLLAALEAEEVDAGTSRPPAQRRLGNQSVTEAHSTALAVTPG
jgi:hypothetical protein